MYERFEFSKAIPRLQTSSSIKNARMAELVDASVSNTDAARRTGSTPVPGTKVSPNGETFFMQSMFVCGGYG